MKTARCLYRVLPSLAVLIACQPESGPIMPVLQADRFDGSEWSEPVNLGPLINTSALDANASLSTDGHTLYFVSNRPEDSGNRTSGPHGANARAANGSRP